MRHDQVSLFMLFAEIEMSMITMKIHRMVMVIDHDWNDYDDYDDDDARSSWPWS